MSNCKKNKICLVLASTFLQKKILTCGAVRQILRIEENCQRFCEKLFAEKIQNCYFISCDQNYKVQDLTAFEHLIKFYAQTELPFIFVINDIDKMMPIVANRLLKKLEEPPQNIHFILTATNESRVLPTIKSRCNWTLTNNVMEPFPFEKTKLIDLFEQKISLLQIESFDLLLKELELNEQSSREILNKIISNSVKKAFTSQEAFSKTQILIQASPLLPQIGLQNFWRYLFLRLA